MAGHEESQSGTGKPLGGRAVPDPKGAGSPAPSGTGNDRMQQYWRLNVLLIAVLLTIWALVSYFAGIIFVEPMNSLWVGRLRAGFWFAQQGSIYVFIILIFVYSFVMDILDRKFDVHE